MAIEAKRPKTKANFVRKVGAAPFTSVKKFRYACETPLGDQNRKACAARLLPLFDHFLITATPPVVKPGGGIDLKESIYAYAPSVNLFEARSVRTTYGDSYSMGQGWRSTYSESRSHYETTLIDSGILCLTATRIVFIGSRFVRDLKLSDIISFVSTFSVSDGLIEIKSRRYSKAMLFEAGDVLNFSVLYNYLTCPSFHADIAGMSKGDAGANVGADVFLDLLATAASRTKDAVSSAKRNRLSFSLVLFCIFAVVSAGITWLTLTEFPLVSKDIVAREFVIYLTDGWGSTFPPRHKLILDSVMATKESNSAWRIAYDHKDEHGRLFHESKLYKVERVVRDTLSFKEIR